MSKETGVSDEFSFGRWLQRRRKALDLTQAALARRVGCAAETLRKIEADVRRPSRQLAERLSNVLELPEAERKAFVRAARAEHSTDLLTPPTQSVPQVAFVPPAVLPSGTVTFFFTDIEGSTQLWEQRPEAMGQALARHDTLLRNAVEFHGGVIFKTTGDGICAVFTRAADALTATLAAQHAFQQEMWGETGSLHVRMALHTGAADLRSGDYFGSPVNRVARLLAAGHGGQILLSLAAEELVRDELPALVELRDLGIHRLKDLTRPEHIFQVVTSSLPAEFPPLKTLNAYFNNLPVQPTPLIGREAEVAQVCALLRHPQTRLVTLTGPGGVGKTRLALQIAAELVDVYPSGVYFVPLEPISDPAFVITAIMQALGITETSSRPLRDMVRTHLQNKQLLLLLDNFEQVMTAAPLINDLLSAAPQLNVLVTSREVLRLRGEKGVVVPPLAVPDRKQMPLSVLSQYAAVALFIARALDVKSDFVVNNENAPTVAEICHRLDGLPLAIELAAARIKLFTPQALLARLDDRLKLLSSGARDLPARQQTLRNTIDWSYNLLDEGEKTLFVRLGVFVGGCALEAVEAVCNSEYDLAMDEITGLTALVDKSLLRQMEGLEGEPRFVMLETIRQYALEQLNARGATEVLRQQHATHFLALTEAAELHLQGSGEVIWLNRLEMEIENFRAALEWALQARKLEIAMQLSGSLWRFWEARGYWSEGRKWLEALLTERHHAPLSLQVNVLMGAGKLELYQDNYLQARSHFEESLMFYQKLDDEQGMERALHALGTLAQIQGDLAQARGFFEQALRLNREQAAQPVRAKIILNLGMLAHYQGESLHARALYEESIAIAKQLGDEATVLLGLINLGVMLEEKDYAQATTLYEESLMLSRKLGNPRGISSALARLGSVALKQGNALQAKQLFKECLALAQEQRDTWRIGDCLVGLAREASMRGQPMVAAQLLAAVNKLWGSLNVPMPHDIRIEYESILTSVCAKLHEHDFAVAWDKGCAMPLEEAIIYALAGEA
jgi:predicted ATPase/class 3 adenylate cyclase/Tfp pilus assembly protein PilF